MIVVEINHLKTELNHMKTMSQRSQLDIVDAIRETSRRLVRELGFMGGNFAGTDLSPSAVHALIEAESGEITARDLADRLRLEKSSVSRMVKKLIEAGDLQECRGADGRVKLLSLTPAGKSRVAKIHAFGRRQVLDALDRLDNGDDQTVLHGLSLYSEALAAEPKIGATAQTIDIVPGYVTGLIASVTAMHAHYYAHHAGFGRAFEAVVAQSLGEFCGRLESPRNAIWSARLGEEVIGSIAIDGEDMGDGTAHLRWFIVGDGARGTGMGRQLLSRALDFVDGRGFGETHLWTFGGLDAARYLYEAHGFKLVEEKPGTQWGDEVLEQHFVRETPQGQGQ